MPTSAKMTSLLLLLFVAGTTAFFALRHSDRARMQTTDDAYVRVDAARVAPRVAGHIVELRAEENREVAAGELLAVIDERDFALAVRRAEAALAAAEAARDGLAARLAQQAEIIKQAEAEVAADRATLELNRRDHARYRELAAGGAESRQARDRAAAALRVAEANLARDLARQAAERGQTAILKADLTRAEAEAAQARAALEQARLNLSHCRVIAPIAGVISQKSAQLGDYVQPGETLLALVPLADIYIEAHFRETQLARIREGQPVRVAVDAFPDRAFRGRVASLGPASNASFSPLPPHSASANFTKIAQRLPVRIAFEDAGGATLRAGMSVVVTVDTGTE